MQEKYVKLTNDEKDAVVAFLPLYSRHYLTELINMAGDSDFEEQIYDEMQNCWNLRQSIIDGKDKLDPKESNDLAYMLENLPAVIRDDQDFDNFRFVVTLAKVFEKCRL